MDPLLIQSGQASPATDGYSMGITILMALTGLAAHQITIRCRQLLR